MMSSLQAQFPYNLSGKEFEKNVCLTGTEDLSEEVTADDTVSKLPWT